MASFQENDKILQGDATNLEGKTPKSDVSIKTMSTQQYIEESYNDIPKSPNDKRLYRGLLLSNKMKVMLVSDATTDTSAAALDVNIGYFNDPEDLPGLAHFCEHMLFLGTEKYPKENEYTSYLSKHGGSSNAVTREDCTTYYFNIDPEKLHGALDRFSQFFIAPLFTESLTELELSAVHSEHEKNIANDIARFRQVDRSSANPNHPYSKFATGNKETLQIIPKQKGINVREKLLEFHQKYYSANLMSLCVLGKESLDELEEMVVEMFSKVENKGVPLPEWPEHPFNESHFQKKWFIVPVKDIRSLNIVFPLPDMEQYYKSVPSHYVSHLLGHEGEGSLLSALKARGWCNSLISGKLPSAKGFSFFTITVDLTQEGIQHVDDIITLTFQYINMIKQEGPIEWIFNEMKDISEMAFQFLEKKSPKSLVNNLVNRLQSYPMEDVLTVGYLYDEWRPDLINWVMDHLKPQNIRVQIVGKAFECIANETEHWYDIKFKTEEIKPEIIESWGNAGLNSDLKLPTKNEFIPSRFDIKLPGKNVDKFPTIIEDSPLIRLWFKQDDEFLVPKAALTFDFVSPLAYMDPVNHNLTYIFVQLFRDALNEYAYAAELAGLKWELNNNKYGITLVIGGFDDKQGVLLEKIMDKMTNFTVDPKRFEVLKDNYIRSLKNFGAEQPYQHAIYYLAVLLAEQVWTKQELLEACDQLTVETVQNFIPQLLSKVHVECLVHGNVTMTEAIDIAKLVETKLTTNMPQIVPLLPKQLVLYREVKLEDGCHFLYEVENNLHKSSCTEVYYQTGLQSTEANMHLQLLAQIISEPCFNVLRTKEQLGYIVGCGIRRTNGAQGLRIIVQSERHPQYVEKRIDLFMDSMLEYISTMPAEEFEKYKESLATERLVKPKQLGALSTVFWNEISCQQYNFDRTNIEVAYLKTITQNQLLEYFKEMVHNELQHKLSVHVISTTEGGATNKEEENNVVQDDEFVGDKHNNRVKKIEDIVAFKISQSLYPLLKPFNNIPRKGARFSKL